MSNSINISPTGGAPDSTYGGHSNSSQDGAPTPARVQEKAEDSSPDPADLRLVIEDDEATGTYVYKTIDRRTGQVVQQYPRDQILKLRDASDYTAGAVIKAKV